MSCWSLFPVAATADTNNVGSAAPWFTVSQLEISEVNPTASKDLWKRHGGPKKDEASSLDQLVQLNSGLSVGEGTRSGQHPPPLELRATPASFGGREPTMSEQLSGRRDQYVLRFGFKLTICLNNNEDGGTRPNGVLVRPIIRSHFTQKEGGPAELGATSFSALSTEGIAAHIETHPSLGKPTSQQQQSHSSLEFVQIIDEEDTDEITVEYSPTMMMARDTPQTSVELGEENKTTKKAKGNINTPPREDRRPASLHCGIIEVPFSANPKPVAGAGALSFNMLPPPRSLVDISFLIVPVEQLETAPDVAVGHAIKQSLGPKGKVNPTTSVRPFYVRHKRTRGEIETADQLKLQTLFSPWSPDDGPVLPLAENAVKLEIKQKEERTLAVASGTQYILRSRPIALVCTGL